jgi:predicted transport protein
LRRLENHQRKEIVYIDEYTIEHILPQNENLSAAWKTSLGQDWQRIHQTYLHTLGNLTLTGYNSQYSDKPFPDKRDMKGGFRESPLQLNQGLGAIENWNEAAIRQRAERLSDWGLQVWLAPKLDPAVLETYKVQTPKTSLTLDDYPHLAIPDLRKLFLALRQEILALDSCVTEEFLKHYIAYKAETNFVDIVPQSKRLRLSLNLPFTDIEDPKGICKDVSTSGRWGNGDVEVGLASVEDLPYVMGLVRQALERQMES